MTAIKKALDDFANGCEEVAGDMLPKDLRANVKRALLAGALVLAGAFGTAVVLTGGLGNGATLGMLLSGGYAAYQLMRGGGE